MASGENSQQGMPRAPDAAPYGKESARRDALDLLPTEGRKYPLVIVSDSSIASSLSCRDTILAGFQVYTNRLRISEKKLFPVFPCGDPDYGNANCKCSLRPGRRSTASL